MEIVEILLRIWCEAMPKDCNTSQLINQSEGIYSFPAIDNVLQLFRRDGSYNWKILLFSKWVNVC